VFFRSACPLKLAVMVRSGCLGIDNAYAHMYVPSTSTTVVKYSVLQYCTSTTTNSYSKGAGRNGSTVIPLMKGS
jgi:hypothetical protein